MKVSIIVPFHKGIFYLEDALLSLREQTYKDIEVLLICDHVEEDIEPLIKEYQEELNLKVHDLGDKHGVAAARNLGLSLAQGEYIYFLDSDDYVGADTLEFLVSAAESRNADLTYGKKIWTWLKRSTYLIKLELDKAKQEEEDESDGEEDEDGLDSNQLNMENGGESENKSSINDDILLSETEGEEENEGELDKQKLAYYNLISSRKGARNISVLHILMRRSLIEENKIRFHEDLLYLSDYPFLIQVLDCAASFERIRESIYVKRHHNDIANYPSLRQMPESKSFTEYVAAYEYATDLLDKDNDLRLRLDKKLLNYYVKVFAPKLSKSRKMDTLNNQFTVLSRLVGDVDDSLIRQQKGYRRKLLKALLSGDLNKSMDLVNRHLVFKKIKRILKNRRALVKFIYTHFFLKKPIKENWVFCESFFGKNYSDSPKYIYEYLCANYPGKYRFIWVIDKKHTKIPYRHTKVKRFSLRYCYYLARCKYYIFNGRQPEWVRKRKGNVFLQTWHGTPLKRLVFDLEDINSSTLRYKKQTYNQSRAWDYLIAANQFSSDIFHRCFKFEKEMLETGYPRNDILHHQDKERIAGEIRDRLGIPKDKRTILYAPTWRDDEYYTKGKYKFSLHLDLHLLKEKLGKDYVILLRTHYFIADSLDVTGLEDFAFNLSKYDDIAELYLISDILITDYSSVFFDYANLKRPMLFYMYDLEKYRDILRGFYIDIEQELPGPILTTSEEVVDAIQEIEGIEKQYEDKYDAFYDKFCSWEDGTASKKVAEAVFDLHQSE